MRVLLINDYQTLGGVEVVVDRTATILREDGHVVEIFTGDQCVDQRNPLGYISSGQAKRALARKLHGFAPDAIHIHNLYHLLSPAILKVCKAYRMETGARIVVTAHDHHLVCPNPGGSHWQGGQRKRVEFPVRCGLMSLLGSRWDHRSMGHSLLRVFQWWWNYSVLGRHLIPDAIVCPSTALAELVVARGHPNVLVISNPLPMLPDIEAPEPSSTLRVAVVGRIEPEKGVANFIASWPSSVEALIQVVGEGSELAECRRCSELLASQGSGLKVEFLGRLTHQDTIRVISLADVVAVPSQTPEVAPLVLDESLAVGTRLLVSNQPALMKVVCNPDIGWVFDPNDAQDLAVKAMEIQACYSAGHIKSHVSPSQFQDRAPGSYAKVLNRVYGG